MCDIYSAKCSYRNCDKELEMHIADFNYPEEDVEVFCEEHLPSENITVYEVNKELWGVRVCRGKREPESAGIYPNTDWKVLSKKYDFNF